MSSNYEKLEEVGGTPARPGAYDPHPAPPSSPPPVVAAAASPAVAVAPGQQQIPTAAAAPQGAVPTAFAMPAGAHGVPVHAQMHAASAGMYPVVMPDLPDAVEAWNGLQGLMQWYLSFSVVLIVISFIFGLLFFIFLPSGLMGTIAASMHLNERCRGRGSVIGAVGTIRVLSAVSATLDMMLAGILFLVTLAAGGKAVGFFVALTMIYGGHGLISIHVFNQSSRVADAVNPVTRGVVVL